MLTNSFNYIDVNFTVKLMSEKQKYIVDTQLDYKRVCLTIWIFFVRSFLNFKCIFYNCTKYYDKLQIFKLKKK